MALLCSACGSDAVQTLADRDKCLSCGAIQVHGTGEPAESGLVWTSERPDGTFEDTPAEPDPVVLKNQADIKAKA